MTFTLAIVGRPNVGKSPLFNRLVGRKLALVDDQPGVTRDLREGDAKLMGLRFTVIDTAGLEDVTDDSLQGRMRRLTERAVDMADICLFLVDGRQGITATDQVFAEILRRKAARVIVGVNKSEGRAGDAGALEAWELGLGEPLRLSAEHGEGMDDLYYMLRPIADEFEERAAADTHQGRQYTNAGPKARTTRTARHGLGEPPVRPAKRQLGCKQQQQDPEQAEQHLL